MFSWFKKPISLCRTAQKTIIWHIFTKKKNEKPYNFWKKLWTNPFDQMKILWLYKIDVFLSTKPIYLSRTSLNTSVRLFLNKKKEWKRLQFLEKPWTNPLEKCKFCTFSNGCFYRLYSLFLYVERHQTLLFGIF